MSNDVNAPVIEEFRANGGRVGGWFEGARLVLLTTTGARSGMPLIHDTFRRELGLIRAEVAKSGPVLGAQLREGRLDHGGGRVAAGSHRPPPVAGPGGAGG